MSPGGLLPLYLTLTASHFRILRTNLQDITLQPPVAPTLSTILKLATYTPQGSAWA
jgi:hypothetical protein